MFSYSYKLNNSYTVYVYPSYVNDCINASKKISHNKKIGESVNKKEKIQYDKTEKDNYFPPLSVNTRLQHKTYGFGNVVSTSKTGIMQVKFAEKTVKFVFPDAIKQGFLKLA